MKKEKKNICWVSENRRAGEAGGEIAAEGKTRSLVVDLIKMNALRQEK